MPLDVHGDGKINEIEAFSEFFFNQESRGSSPKLRYTYVSAYTSTIVE